MPWTILTAVIRSLFLLLALCFSATALAEGSRDLLGAGATDYRPAFETGYGGGTTSGIARKTTLYAYARVGEQIAVGSSSMGVGASAINIFTYAGTTAVASYSGSTCGVIQNRSQEVAGPSTITGNTGGYTPCLYPVTTAGIYRIEMASPSNGTTNPPPRLVSAGWTTPVPATDSTIAAWDVSVITGTVTRSERKGRVFARYLALNVGSNNTYINLTVYAQTRDGYLYRVNQLLDPFGYIFFANNKGLRTATTPANPAYISAPQTNTSFFSPASADTATDFTDKLFMNPPDTGMPASSDGDWLYPGTAVLPATPTGLSFTGIDGTPGYAGSSGGYTTGGVFSFTNPGTVPFAYRITIPLSSNGTSTDRVLLGTAAPGSNTASWDGLDGKGAAVPVSSTGYSASVKLLGGEIHFPLLDVENAKGLTITRQNLTGSVGSDDDPSLIFWDDRGVAQIGGPSNPLNPPKGVNSLTPAHTFGDGSGTGFGNNNTIDTWAYYPSSPTISGNAVVVRSADIRIVKAAVSTGAPRGRAAVYTLSVSNQSSTPGPITVTVADALPAWATAMSWTCAAGCTAASGTGALSTGVTLTGNTPVVIRVSVTGSATTTLGSSVTNTGTVTRAADTTDPDTTNNTSSVALTVRDPVTGIALLKEQRNVTQGGSFGTANVTVRPGDVLQYRLTFTASGDKSFTALTLRDPLETPLLPGSTGTLTCPNGTVTSPAITQAVSVNVTAACGTLNPGDTGTLVFSATVR